MCEKRFANLPKVSIIVPVYNAEKYLERCLQSILQQNMTDFELICINDGSTDRSNDILKQCVQKDQRVRLIEQKNQGVSVARNHGIDAASGEYIAFIDADDWVDTDFLFWLYTTAKKRKCAHYNLQLLVRRYIGISVGNEQSKDRLFRAEFGFRVCFSAGRISGVSLQ